MAQDFSRTSPLRVISATFRDAVEFNGKKTVSEPEFHMEAGPIGLTLIIHKKKILTPWSNVIWMQVE